MQHGAERARHSASLTLLSAHSIPHHSIRLPVRFHSTRACLPCPCFPMRRTSLARVSHASRFRTPWIKRGVNNRPWGEASSRSFTLFEYWIEERGEDRIRSRLEERIRVLSLSLSLANSISNFHASDNLANASFVLSCGE